MENFTAWNPVRLHFGKDVLLEMSSIAGHYGKKALVVYGRGSVRRNGSYDTAMEQLGKAGIETIEYSGIKPNPLVSDVDQAAALGREQSIDMVVAIGGGSVIDSAKIISVCISENCAAWDVMKQRIDIKGAIPLLSVLTLAATGTEMNPTAVLQNPETMEKIGFKNPHMYPRHSFLDPAYTLSVPADYTAFGIADLVAHCLEAFFGQGDASLSDRFVESIIRESFLYGPMLMKDLKDYDLRARIMWAATNALNGMTLNGRKSGDWGVHALGHTLSFLYDTPHGATLTIVYPAWLRYISRRDPDRIKVLGQQLYDKADVNDTIESLENYFREIDCPVRLPDIGIGQDKKDEILELMNKNQAGGLNYQLDDDGRKAVLELMYLEE